MPLVSALIPSYNHAAFVADTVRGALAQTVRDLEVVVVDGSTDNTPRVLDRFNDPRLRVVRIRNEGVSQTFNTCLREARGQYLAFCPSDDVWLPEHLETVLARLRRGARADLAYSMVEIIDAESAVRHPGSFLYGERQPEGDVFAELLEGNFIPFPTVLMPRALIDEFGPFDESIQRTQDHDLWLRIAPFRAFGCTGQVTARVRWHGGNVSTPGARHDREVLEEKVRSLRKVARLHAGLLEERGIETRLREVLASAHARLASRTLNRKDAVREYARAISVRPGRLDLYGRLLRSLVFGPSRRSP